MTFWDGIAESIVEQCVDTFATGTYTYTHKSSGQVEQVDGVFETDHEIVNVVEGVPVSTFGPVLGVHLASFQHGAPAKGDEVVIAGVTYEVFDPQPDGQRKGADLVLRVKP